MPWFLAVKTDKILMADVNSKIEAPEAAGLEKKVHFKKLKKFNEKRAANSSKYSRFNSFLLFIPANCFLQKTKQDYMDVKWLWESAIVAQVFIQ